MSANLFGVCSEKDEAIGDLVAARVLLSDQAHWRVAFSCCELGCGLLSSVA